MGRSRRTRIPRFYAIWINGWKQQTTKYARYAKSGNQSGNTEVGNEGIPLEPGAASVRFPAAAAGSRLGCEVPRPAP